MISKKDIENIIEGETNINFLITKYGEPTFTGAFNKNAYYQNETTRILPAGKKEIISRTILALEVNSKVSYKLFITIFLPIILSMVLQEMRF